MTLSPSPKLTQIRLERCEQYTLGPCRARMVANPPAFLPASPEPCMTYQASDEVIEQIWKDLHRSVPRYRVAEVAREVAAGFADAKVAAYIPLFVRRTTCERLLPEANAVAADQGGVEG